MLTILVILAIHDLNADQRIDGADLSALLSQWGPGENKRADFNDDGRVDGADLARLLTHFGVQATIELEHVGGGGNWEGAIRHDRVGDFGPSPFGPAFRRRAFMVDQPALASPDQPAATVTHFVDEAAL